MTPNQPPDWTDRHPRPPHARFDGGDLDCGNGLLLLIRKHIDPLDGGQLLEILSTDATVEDDLPAWCRLTGNDMVSRVRDGAVRSYVVRKRTLSPPPLAGLLVPPSRQGRGEPEKTRSNSRQGRGEPEKTRSNSRRGRGGLAKTNSPPSPSWESAVGRGRGGC